MLTLAWDVDDVLNDLMHLWFEKQWLPAHPDCAIKYDDLTENPPHRILEVSINEYLSSLDSFRLSKQYQEMNPVIEIKKWLIKYGSRFRHIALTTVPLHAASASSSWVFKHFGEWIRTFHVVPSKRTGQEISEYDSTKAEFLKWIGKVDIIVDDNELNIKDAEIMGIKGILMPRPWNKGKNAIARSLESLKNL